MIKKILIVLVVLGAIGGAYGYYMWNKKPPTTASRTADVTITANELGAQYDNAKYLGKVLQVKGMVTSIATDDKGTTNINIETEDPLVSISCEMEAGSPPPSVKEGEEVTMKGQCDGKLTDIVLTRCIIVK